jgi:hypothetical protein
MRMAPRSKPSWEGGRLYRRGVKGMGSLSITMTNQDLGGGKQEMGNTGLGKGQLLHGKVKV